MTKNIWLMPAAALFVLMMKGQSDGGPLFTVASSSLPEPLKLIDYGDMRFTDTSEKKATNPKVRQWLVDRVAAEHPAAVMLSGDVPWHGGEAGDYREYHAETKIWRDNHLLVYPALGNHEMSKGSKEECLQNWWNAFPELKGHSYYSVRLGSDIYVINLDSNDSLLPGSAQRQWIDGQFGQMPGEIRWVFINLHHPPVSDFQVNGDASHNARPNEVALRDYLSDNSLKTQASFIVIGGHVHNYERFLRDNIVYLVSGGGGADPKEVIRTSADLYQNTDFPNYHYLTFVRKQDRLEATMTRLKDAEGAKPEWEIRDRFEVPAVRKR
jgi:hypothetical protein